MSREEFYMSLPSDATDEFPNNTTNSFKVRLPTPVRLAGDGWKVGLGSISWPDEKAVVPDLLKGIKSNWFSYTYGYLQNRDTSVNTHTLYCDHSFLNDLTHVHACTTVEQCPRGGLSDVRISTRS